MNVFLSYCFNDEPFVQKVSHYLLRQPKLEPFCYVDEKQPRGWRQQLKSEIDNCEAFVLFVGKKWGSTQHIEASVSENVLKRLVVHLPQACEVAAGSGGLRRLLKSRDPINVTAQDDGNALSCAREIALQLTDTWVPYDGLPSGYPFAYEKDIIEEYARGKGKLSGQRIREGCPQQWPTVKHVRLLQERPEQLKTAPNPVAAEVIGAYRSENKHILVDARSRSLGDDAGAGEVPSTYQTLTFPEAGPRSKICYPIGGPNLGVGVLVTGGIAPGINAVIDGIVERHYLYLNHASRSGKSYNLSIYGYRDGFESLLRNGSNYHFLNETDVRNHANLGGAMLGTSRSQSLLSTEKPARREKSFSRIIQKLEDDGVDILYVIGGDGSMRAAHALWTLARARGPGQGLSVVGIPKTMDNDILWVWQSFGFLSAVEKAKEFLLQLYTEARSNPRLCIMQLFGSDSGFVVSHTALASGVCDAVLIPEMQFSMSKLVAYIFEKLRTRYRPGPEGSSPFGVILMAETAVPVDVDVHLNDQAIGLEEREKKAIENFARNGRRVQGQTPDELRTGSLKIVSRVLEREIRKMSEYDEYWGSFRVFTSEPRHLLRAIAPSASDVIFGHRLGSLAVDNALAGYTDFMISQWLTEYVLVPLELVVLGRKRVPQNGIFWKSVLANTGQPAEMK